ncbi:hypothetical protein RCL1_003140 [Eukaryota sp. TZLM3-RCL]
MLSADDFDSALAEHLISDPIVSSFKAQLRHTVCSQLLDRSSTEQPEHDLTTRICYSLIYQYLESINCEYALSIFLPEASVFPTAILSNSELIQTMPQLKKLPLPLTTPFLPHIVSNFTSPPSTFLTSSVQTDPIPSSIDYPETTSPSSLPLVFAKEREADLLKEIAELRRIIENLQSDRDSLINRNQRLSSSLSSLRADNDHLFEERSKFERLGQTFTSEIELLRAQLETVKSEKAELQASKKNMESLLKALKDDMVSFQMKHNEDKRTIEVLRSLVKKNKTSVSDCSTFLHRPEESMDRVSSPVTASTSRPRYSAEADRIKPVEFSQRQFQEQAQRQLPSNPRVTIDPPQTEVTQQPESRSLFPTTTSRPLEPPIVTSNSRVELQPPQRSPCPVVNPYMTSGASLWTSGTVKVPVPTSTVIKEEEKIEQQQPTSEPFFPVISTPTSRHSSPLSENTKMFSETSVDYGDDEIT